MYSVKTKRLVFQAVSKRSKNMELETVLKQSCNELPWMLSAFRANKRAAPKTSMLKKEPAYDVPSWCENGKHTQRKSLYSTPPLWIRCEVIRCEVSYMYLLPQGRQ